MKILDKNNQELNLNQIDLSLGYLQEEEILMQHIPEQLQYKVKKFIFEDDTVYIPLNENDPHVEIINAENGEFNFIPDKGDIKIIKQIETTPIIKQEEQWIYETIQRYHLYTNEETIIHGLPQRVTQTEESLQETNDSIEDINLNMEDLILLLAEMLGGDEYEENEDESIEE